MANPLLNDLSDTDDELTVKRPSKTRPEKNEDTNELTGREIRKEVKMVLETKNTKNWSQEEIDKHGFVIAGF